MLADTIKARWICEQAHQQLKEELGLDHWRILKGLDRSQRTQIIRHVAELSQHGRIVEIAGSWIASASERDRTGMAQHFPKTLRTTIAAAGLGHSIGSPTTTLPSPTSNGNATKYVIPASSELWSAVAA